MSGWKAKRFWKTASVRKEADGFAVLLDERALRTPAKAPLTLPTRQMAAAIAAEWDAVEAEVDPRRMPVTRSANAAIDKVTPQFDEVAGLIADYGGSDLLCYRDAGSDSLAAAQAAAWDPMLDWAAETFRGRLAVTRGIIPVAQSAAVLQPLEDAVRRTTPFQLTALHDLVTLSGSLVLGLAATDGRFDATTLWILSRFDEEWQAAQWGVDEDAAAAATTKRSEFLHARNFWTLSSAQ